MTNNNVPLNLFSDCFITVRIESEERNIFDVAIVNFFELLAEREFTVTIYEAKLHFGGKA